MILERGQNGVDFVRLQAFDLRFLDLRRFDDAGHVARYQLDGGGVGERLMQDPVRMANRPIR